MKMIDLFNEKSVSFVSVTQHFSRAPVRVACASGVVE
jgi:hypothetical protein